MYQLEVDRNQFLAKFAICRRPSVCLSVISRLSSVVCNVRAPYSGD